MVVFGSQAWTVFADLDEISGPDTPVLIYSSHDSTHHGPTVTWTARYQRYVTSRDGSHPDRMKYRPPSCREEDRSGYWAGFYEISDLAELAPEATIEIKSLRRRDGSSYEKGFVPEGPTIVRR